MMQYVILETLTGVSEIILVFHEVKKDVTSGRQQIFIPKSIIFSSSSPTLFFLLFTSLFPPFSQFQKMGGTWEEHGRNLGGTWEVHGRYMGGRYTEHMRSI